MIAQMGFGHIDRAVEADRLITAGIWTTIVGSFSATVLLGGVISKEVKYAGLMTALTASIAGVAYESREETKWVRAQGRQVRRHGLTLAAQQYQDRLELDKLRLKVNADVETHEIIQAVPPEIKIGMGLPAVGLGVTADADPSTMTIEVQKTPVVQTPAAIAKSSGSTDSLAEYTDQLVSQVVSRFGKDQMSLCLYGASRDGKSTLAQALVYAVALHAIANQNRLIVMVMVRHGVDKSSSDPFHPLWNGLPELPARPSGLASGIVQVTPTDVALYISKVREILEQRIRDNDYSWSDTQSLTPQVILIADDASNQFRALDDSMRADTAANIAAIAQDGSKFGLGLWLLMHDITKDRTGIDPNAWESMRTIYGYKALSGAKGVDDKHSAIAAMTNSKETKGAYGYYSEELGYIAPPPLKSVRELCLNWKVPQVDVFDAQVSLVNMLRDRVKNASSLEDASLISLGIEWSTFTQDELQQMIPSVRALLSFSDAEYESRVASVRAKIMEELP